MLGGRNRGDFILQTMGSMFVSGTANDAARNGAKVVCHANDEVDECKCACLHGVIMQK